MWKAPNGGQAIMLPLLIVQFVVGVVVLLIVVANMAGLILARTLSRQREMSIRLAIGSGRFHIMKQVLLECVVLAILGGGLAIAFASVGLHQFLKLFPKSPLPTGYDFAISWNVLGIALGIAFVAGIVFGLLPAWQAARTPVRQVISDAGRGSEGRSQRLWLRRALVASQVAFAFVLVVCAALCLQSVARSNHVDIGFEPDGLWVANFQLIAKS